MYDKSIQDLKFLHIDDFGNYRSMLKSILSTIGIKKIDDAKDAVSALEKIKENHYDVILCDYNLGDGQNGQQFLEEVMNKKLLIYGTIFIMITAENTTEMVMAAIEWRPDAYLSKPFPKELLIARLEKLIKKKKVLKSVFEAYNDKKYEKAINECNKKMVEYPKMALDIGKLKGEIALAGNKLDIAESIYDKALQMRSFDWAMYGKIQVLFKQQKYDECKKVINDLLAENPNYIEAYDILAQIYEIEKHLDKSQEILETAAKISPRAIFRQQKLAETAIQNNDNKTAERALRASINYGKHSITARSSDHTELAKIYIDKGKSPQATQVLTNARQLYRKDSKALMHLDIIESAQALKQGNEDKARDILTRSIQAMDGSIKDLPETLQNDLIHQCEQLHEDEMAEQLRKDIKGNGESSSDSKKYPYLLQNGKAMRLYKNKKILEASRIFIEAAEHLSDNISVNLNAAQSLIKLIKEKHVKDKKEADRYKEQTKHFLDVSKKLDSANERYKKLEVLYREL